MLTVITGHFKKEDSELAQIQKTLRKLNQNVQFQACKQMKSPQLAGTSIYLDSAALLCCNMRFLRPIDQICQSATLSHIKMTFMKYFKPSRHKNNFVPFSYSRPPRVFQVSILPKSRKVVSGIDGSQTERSSSRLKSGIWRLFWPPGSRSTGVEIQRSNRN